jgi:hypothetical protein
MTPRQKEKVQAFYDDAFNKMFQMVGFEKVDYEFMKNPFWFTALSWTYDTEDSFKLWFVNEYVKRFRKSKKYSEDKCMYFLFQYGWSLSKNSL